MLRHFSAILFVFAATPALATDVQLVGAFGDKAAVLSIDGGAPKTVRVGEKLGAVTVVSVAKDRATIEIDGKRRTLQRGQHYSTRNTADERQSVVLAADTRGHFVTEGSVNGGAVRFIVDTGATSIALAAADAGRLGLDYRKGRPRLIQTANGPVPAWGVTLDSVRIGGIELHQVDALVLERELEAALLGMSFLNRVEMRREGENMILRRRF